MTLLNVYEYYVNHFFAGIHRIIKMDVGQMGGWRALASGSAANCKQHPLYIVHTMMMLWCKNSLAYFFEGPRATITTLGPISQ